MLWNFKYSIHDAYMQILPLSQDCDIQPADFRFALAGGGHCIGGQAGPPEALRRPPTSWCGSVRYFGSDARERDELHDLEQIPNIPGYGFPAKKAEGGVTVPDQVVSSGFSLVYTRTQEKGREQNKRVF